MVSSLAPALFLICIGLVICGLSVAYLIFLRCQLTEMTTHVQQQPFLDGLTEVLHARSLRDALHKEIEKAKYYRGYLGLILIDVDHLKQVNDRYGHEVGDTVLHTLSELIREVIGVSGVVGRMGADEFVVLLPDSDLLQTSRIAEEIRLVSERKAMLETDSRAITVSMGVTICPIDGKAQDELVRKAEIALNWAKRCGGNQVWRYADVVRLDADMEHEKQIEVMRGRYSPYLTLHRERVYAADIALANAMMKLIESRDPAMTERTEAIRETAAAIARELGVSQERVNMLGLAVSWRDIGYVGISAEALHKGELSLIDKETLRQHVNIGVEILNVSPFLSEFVPAIRAHHEHWNGSGYPAQLWGDDIPRLARIIAVAEAYHTLLTAYPYQHSCTPAAALTELERQAEIRFDPQVVQAALHAIHPVNYESRMGVCS